MIERVKKVLRYVLLIEVLLIVVGAVGPYLHIAQFYYLGAIGAYPISIVIILYIVVWIVGKVKSSD